MDGFTGVRDLDREILLKLDDSAFIKISSLNTYFKDLYREQDYLLYKRKLQMEYPDTLIPKVYNKNKTNLWKSYYIKVVKNIKLLKEHDFIYTRENPFLQFRILQTSKKFTNPYIIILHYGIKHNDFSLVQYAIKKDPRSIMYKNLRYSCSLSDVTILKYLIKCGGNISVLQEDNFENFSEKSKKYLRTL